MSYEALDAPARELLLALCVLPGGAGPDLITEVTGSDLWDESAEGLVTSSVWRLVEGRYVMHPLVRQCALESLGEGRADAESRTARALARLAIEASARLNRTTGGAPYIAALDWFAAEWGNLVTSAVSAADAGDGETVVDLAGSIFDFCIARGYWTDAERLHRLGLTAARHSADRPNVVRLLGQLGRIHRRQGRWTEAVTAYREALGLARDLDHRVMQGRLLGNLSRIYQLQGEYEQSVAAASESLEILRAAEDPIGQVESLICLGSVHRFQRRFPEAEAAYREGIAIARQVRDRKSEGKALSYLGKVYGHQKRWAEALVEYEASLRIVREFGDRMGEASITQNLGTVYLERGALKDSEAALTLCLNISRDLNDRVMEGRALRSFARLRARSGDADAALDLARQSVAILEKTEDRWNLARSREVLDEIERSGAGPIADAGEGDVPVGPGPSG
jgi:tetratricopeptide (TPR) repeat protein